MSKYPYERTYRPDHPNSNYQGLVLTHRLVMSEHIGRPLLDGEVVHHLDGNKRNNNIENLELMSTRDHHLEHYQERKDELIQLSRTKQSIEKRKETYKRIAHQQGSSNSNYGKMWITDGTSSKLIHKSDQIPQGWRKGRKM